MKRAFKVLNELQQDPPEILDPDSTHANVDNFTKDNLPTLTTQARNSDKPEDIFKGDGRFLKLHKVLEKIMCSPATPAAVERIFSHGGLFMRPHRACLGPNVLSNLVFSKCNNYLNRIQMFTIHLSNQQQSTPELKIFYVSLQELFRQFSICPFI